MRVVAITQLWPNRIEPLAAQFNRQQLVALGDRCDLEVLAAVPHVPGAKWVGHPKRTAKLADLPDDDEVDGIPTRTVRQLYLPRIGVSVAVPLYLGSLWRHRERIRRADVVLGTWVYPDGCAAILAARHYGKPVFVKVHGTDVNFVAKLPGARSVLRRVLPKADGIVVVSRALGDEIAGLGVPRERIHLVANGVDASVFHPRARAEARKELGVDAGAKLFVFVGRLEKEKGVFELLEAFASVRAKEPAAQLALLGMGSAKDLVHAAAKPFGACVRLLGNVPLETIAQWLGASDVFVLPSWREGTPNVVLEALACARPVVATNVGGIPDVVPAGVGFLVPPKDPTALATRMLDALTTPWDESAILRAAPRSWEASAEALYDVIRAPLT